MKNQYFGDNKDLFTYDLIMHIMRAGLAENLAFIPMLTSNDGTGHGGKFNRNKARAGAKNRELATFLDECISANRRDIRELEGFFEKHAIRINTYNKPFSHRDRGEYFREIGDGLLRKALIFADPDIGLEVRNPNEKHLLYSEVKDLYERMDRDSILMLYQYVPRANRRGAGREP